VFAGQCRLIELGFRQGGPGGFGLRRVLIDQSGAIKATSKPGEHKSLQTDRVILVPGPEQEVATVHKIYRWLVDDDLPCLKSPSASTTFLSTPIVIAPGPKARSARF